MGPALSDGASRAQRHLVEAQRLARVGSWETSDRSRAAWVSPELRRVVGLPEDDSPITLDRVLPLIHPDDRDRYIETLQRFREAGSPGYTIEYRLRRPNDGRECILRHTAVVSVLPDGERLVVGTVQDVTEFRTMERQLAEAQRVAKIGSWEVGEDGHVSMSEEGRRILGAARDVNVDELLRKMFRDDLRVLARERERLLRGASFEMEARIEAPGGDERVILIRAAPAKDTFGRVARSVGTVQDVTRERALERELEASRRATAEQERLATIGTIVAGVNHEIRNALSYLTLGTDVQRMALDEVLADPALAPKNRRLLQEARDSLLTAMKGVEQITSITDGLRSVYRTKSGARQSLAPEVPCNTALLLGSGRLAPSLEVVRDYRSRRRILADEGEIAQVVLNLVLNANDAMADQKGGRIRVATRDDEDRVLIEVEDDGPGIPPEIVPRIMRPFFTTKPNGTGLGLSVCRRIVEEHGGLLDFETAPRVGTTFRLHLPPAPPEAAP